MRALDSDVLGNLRGQRSQPSVLAWAGPVSGAMRKLRLGQEATAKWDWVDDKENHSFSICHSEVTVTLY